MVPKACRSACGRRTQKAGRPVITSWVFQQEIAHRAALPGVAQLEGAMVSRFFKVRAPMRMGEKRSSYMADLRRLGKAAGGRPEGGRGPRTGRPGRSETLRGKRSGCQRRAAAAARTQAK